MNTTLSITDTATHDVRAIFDAMCNWEEIETKLDVYSRPWNFNVAPDRQHEEELLHRALSHPRPVYRIVAVEFGCLMPSVVERGIRDNYWRVRWTAAQCGAAAPEWLASTVDDTSPEVRRAAAGHKLMPQAALRQLLVDPVAAVREQAARHPSFDEADLCAMAEYADPVVRRVVAGRSATVATLEQLAADPDVEVAEAVADNSKANAQALHLITCRSTNQWVLKRVATHDNTAVRDLLTIVECGGQVPASAIAMRSGLREVLNAVAQHPDPAVRAVLLTNTNATAETLMLMPLDATVAEHRAAAGHCNASFAVCRRLAVHYLSSSHHGRRKIGIEMVRVCMAKVHADTGVVGELSHEPFDIVYALLTDQHCDALLAWAQDATGPKWLRRYVLAQLGVDDTCVTQVPCSATERASRVSPDSEVAASFEVSDRVGH